MNETPDKKNQIREYLLGRVSGERELSQIEEQLFLDEDLCSLAEVTEDALLDDLVFERLSDTDRYDLLRTLENNPDRRRKLAIAGALRKRTAEQKIAADNAKPSIVASIRAYFSHPVFSGAVAVVLIAAIAGVIFVLRRQSADELADLKNIYKKARPVESRLTGFDYAPLPVTRGENAIDVDKNRIELEKTKLLRAVIDSPTAANLHDLGVFYLTQQDYQSAIENLEKAVGVNEKDPKIRNDLGSAYFERAVNGKGNRLLDLGRANEAFSKSIELDPASLEPLFNKALTLQAIPLKNEAKDAWNLYLQRDPDSKWADEARKSLEKLELMGSGSKRTKEQVMNDFLAAYRSHDEATALNIQNSTKGVLTGLSPAEQLTQKFLEARRAHDGPAIKELSEAMIYIGNLEKEKYADFFFADLADFYLKTDDRQIEDLLKAKMLLAEAYPQMKGNASGAAAKFGAGQMLFKKANADVEADLANLWRVQTQIYEGKISDGLTTMSVLLERAGTRRHKVIFTNLSYWIGVCEYKQGAFSRFVSSTKTALETAKENDNYYEIVHSAEGLAGLYNDLDETERSIYFMSNALGKENSYYVNQTQAWRNLNTTCDLFDRLHAPLTAIDFARESVEVSKTIFEATDSGSNDAMRYLANALEKADRLRDALLTANESNQMALGREKTPQNNKTAAETFVTRADIERELGKCDAALEDYDRALAYYADLTEVVQDLYDLHKGKLQCFDSLGLAADFDTELATVLRISEEYRANIREDDSRQSFFDNEQVIFDTVIANSLGRGDTQAAYEFAETSRARSLLEFVKSDRSINDVEKDFASVSKPLGIRQIQQQMADNVEILEYQVLGDKLAIWAITKGRFQIVQKQIGLTDLDSIVDEYRRAITGRGDPQRTRELAARLYSMLIPDALEPGKTLCLIPDKSLHEVPFASLISTSNRYLIEDHALIYSPSASIFILATANARTKEKLGEKLLSIGNPHFDPAEDPTLRDLPGAEVEAAEIAKLYETPRILLADSATKESFLDGLGAAQIVHFAGHFVANTGSSGNSKMIFANGDLRVFELADKKLPRSKLVVLSACDTGFEQFNKSEGAIGIARTFLALGAPLVVASAWKVDSDAAGRLMIAFHKKRRVDKLPSVEALRQSQLAMLKDPQSSDPYYWAAFSATGGLAAY